MSPPNVLRAPAFTENPDELLERRKRDYAGPAHAFHGAHGQKRLDGLTLRDVGDAVTVTIKDMLGRLGKAEQLPEFWTAQVLQNVERILADGDSTAPKGASPPMWPTTVITCGHCLWQGSPGQMRAISLELRGCGSCGRTDKLKRTQEPRPMGWGARSPARALQLLSDAPAPTEEQSP